MIQRGLYSAPANDKHPNVIGSLRSVVPCGCTIIQGIRLDNHEVATAAYDCGAEGHGHIIGRAYDWLVDSLNDPRDEDLIVVIDEFLTRAYDEIVGPGK